MQFKRFFAVAMATSVIASPMSPISDTIAAINTALTAMNSKISAWQGDVVEASNILLVAQDLLAVIDKSTATVKGMSPLPLTEAVSILQPANALVKQTNQAVDGLSAKKDSLVKAELGSVVKDTFSKFKTGATSLLAAIREKLPDNVKTVGDSIGKQINSALDKGIAAF
jgi:hypothetical protein